MKFRNREIPNAELKEGDTVKPVVGKSGKVSKVERFGSWNGLTQFTVADESHTVYTQDTTKGRKKK